jgi:hypothetical protein
MMFDEPSTAASSWASRLRSTVTPKSSKDKEKERKGKLSSSPPPASSSMSLLSKRKSSKDMDVTRDESSRDRLNSLVSESELGAAVGMSDKEKAVARRKAAKLEQVFGDPPPQAMYLPSHRPSMSVNLSRDIRRRIYRQATTLETGEMAQRTQRANTRLITPPYKTCSIWWRLTERD